MHGGAPLGALRAASLRNQRVQRVQMPLHAFATVEASRLLIVSFELPLHQRVDHAIRQILCQIRAVYLHNGELACLRNDHIRVNRYVLRSVLAGKGLGYVLLRAQPLTKQRRGGRYRFHTICLRCRLKQTLRACFPSAASTFGVRQATSGVSSAIVSNKIHIRFMFAVSFCSCCS